MIDYLALIKRSWQISWKNKYLWWFGLFLGSVSVGFPNFYGINSTSNSEKVNIDTDLIINQTKDFLITNQATIIISLIALLVFGLICFIISIISQGAIVSGIEKIEQGKKENFISVFKAGYKNFWLVLGLRITQSFIGLFLTILIFIPSILAIIYKSYIFGIILLFIALIIVLIISTILAIWSEISIRDLVLKKNDVFASIASGWIKLWHNLKDVFIYWLTTLVLGIIVGLIAFILAFIVIMLTILLCIIIYTLTQWIGVIIFTSIIMLSSIIFGIICGAVLNTFYSSYWTLFWQKLK